MAPAAAQPCLVDGNVNDDAVVTPVDALRVFQHVMGMAIPPLTACQQERADVNRDGRVSPADARCILQRFLGLSECSSPSLGRVVGSLIVPPHQTVEAEPNESIDEAQTIANIATVAGHAAMGDAGFLLPGFVVRVEDLYRLQTAEPVRIMLTIAADDLRRNDLDLLLMNNAGGVFDASEGLSATELLETSEAGDFVIGVRAYQGASSYVLAVVPLGDLAASQPGTLPPGADFVPGQILVKWQADNRGQRQAAASLNATYGLTPLASLPPDVMLLHTPLALQAMQHGTAGGKLQLPQSQDNALRALTFDTIRRLRRDPAVAYAEPNFIRHASRVPDDSFFNLQWHYELINLPEAWDITTGSNDVIVAVIDTGVLEEHPDLAPRLFDGFDFIRDPTNANDGNGIDNDAHDPGDDPLGASSSFHGTHVAGTVGALTNNAIGVAGVTWQTRLMPLRVLGVQGGTDADIAQAIRYAARLSNISGTLPAARAHIINMSLGGPGFSQTLQDAVLAARDQGVIVVAAAGNENTNAFQTPASLEGVIAVAAVDRISQKAPYSNFGPRIDVAAPGGNTSVDLDADRFADGVLSTLGNDQQEFFFRFYQGTSMAAPHVAGVIALMLDVNPDLTPQDIEQLLAATHPETTTPITRDLGPPGRDDIFGHGLIDAAAAVTVASSISGGSGTTPAGSILAVSTAMLNFENFMSMLAFEITNAGTGTMQILEITADVPWLSLTPTSGTAPLMITVTIDRTGLAEGVHTAMISITSDATQGNATATISVRIEVGGTTLGDIGAVVVLVVNQDTFEAVAETVTDFTQNYAFTTPSVMPGTYRIVAGTDRDDNGVICESEDACGVFPDPVSITAEQNVAGITFVVGEFTTPQNLPATFAPYRGRPFARRIP
jgi:serine protease